MTVSERVARRFVVAKTVYILKNHNGRVLARITDPKKLAQELMKYEVHTGNRTLVEVVKEGDEEK